MPPTMAKDALYLRPDDEVPDGLVPVRLSFDAGTIVARGVSAAQCAGCGLTWDERIGHGRAPAFAYRVVVGALLNAGFSVVDEARQFDELDLRHDTPFEPHEHQADALEAWLGSGRAGLIVLPTGSGKSFVAELVMAEVRRDTLVIAPTLDLVDQWIRRLDKAFGHPVGALGGGRHEPDRITVSTYDSAAIHMERLGGRFGLVVFDEVHHLPGDLYRQCAEHVIAPFRLGLTATPERDDGRHKALHDLVGPPVFRLGIKDLSGDILADYRVETVEVEMNPADRDAYTQARQHYRGFVESNGIRVGSRGGWRRFLAATSRSEEGRAALAAYYRQKRLALAHEAKLDRLGELLEQHWHDRIIVFANDNDTVYRISERFLCPTITHQTPLSERTEILQRFSSGEYRVVVTSKVLNEGVDVPEANVAIILSGTGSVREHVQRLGRILRRKGGEQALLYEVVTADSVETHQSERRRKHDAYN